MVKNNILDFWSSFYSCLPSYRPGPPAPLLSQGLILEADSLRYVRILRLSLRLRCLELRPAPRAALSTRRHYAVSQREGIIVNGNLMP